MAVVSALAAAGQPVIVPDSIDAVIRRTDVGNDGPLDEQLHRLPDITAIRYGKFAPVEPWVDRFAGAWSQAGTFVRIEIEFAGLQNPPGPLWYSDENPTYQPFRYGPHPVCGWIEFDMDASENTGGELNAPQNRYLGAVARFGGLPSEARFAGRAAVTHLDLDGDVQTPPFVERSGEEFHIALLGESIESIAVVVESPGGDAAQFEAGETWDLAGRFFHRAHAFDPFAFSCVSNPGGYTPTVVLRFAHSIATDRTTVTLVYPLTHEASASLAGPGVPVEPHDGCDGNQNSVAEALADLQFSAEYADWWTQQDPRFVLMAGWAAGDVNAALDPATWRTCAVVGACYISYQADHSRYAWTDVVPDVRPGDYDGDGCLTPADAAEFADYVSEYDGQSGYDADGDSGNGMMTIPQFSRGFCLFDMGYDGVVEAVTDIALPGDLNADGNVDMDDVPAMVLALLDPAAYAVQFGVPAGLRGDLTCDGRCDGQDIQPFVQALCTPRCAPSADMAKAKR